MPFIESNNKDKLNIYNSLYSQLLKDISNSDSNKFTISKRFLDYQFNIKNTFTNSNNNNNNNNLQI